MLKSLKKATISIISFIVAVACTGLTATAMTGCNPETDHPEVRITYEFNGATYDVEYTLYRNMYPNTVRHFIELSENGFYDNTIIHNYQTNDWFAGGYSYNAEDYSAKADNVWQIAEYLEDNSKEKAYNDLFNEGKLTPSVFRQTRYNNGKEYVDKSDGLPTLMGEFYNNINQEIEKGALTADYGCLKMYYYEKESKQKIYVTPTSDQVILADYKNNCATSYFSLQTGSSTSYSEKNYAVFARLKDADAFDGFVNAVKDYIGERYSGSTSSFYNSGVEANVDNYDNFSDKQENDKGKSVTYNVPRNAIVIKSVQVTKY